MPDELLSKNATISDVMWLIAGTAVAFTVWRTMMAMPIWSGFPDSLQWYYFQALGTTAFLTPFSLTLLLIEFRQPRLELTHLLTKPVGLVGFSVLFILTVDTALLALFMVLVGWPMATITGGKVFYYCRLIAEQTGMAVGSGFFIQISSRRYRKPSGWLDISGTVLAVCWMVLGIVSVLFTLL
jgi:hypothetical protein